MKLSQPCGTCSRDLNSRRLPGKTAKFLALAAVLVPLVIARFAPESRAATLFWDADGATTTGTGGTGTWDLTLQAWRNGSATGTLQAWTDTAGTTDTADFAGTAGTVTMGAGLGALGLIFDTAGYTVATSTFTLTLGTGGITANNTTGTETISSGTGGLTLAGAQVWMVASGGTLAVSSNVANGGFTLATTGAGADNISGVISGTGGLAVNSTGTTTLSANNTYSGATTISAGGSLQISAATTETYGATGAVTNNGTLFLSPASGATLTYGAAVGGAGALTKLGAGTAVLTSGNYTGATSVSAGTLRTTNSGMGTQALVGVNSSSGITVTSGAGLELGIATNNSQTITVTPNITINGAGPTRGALYFNNATAGDVYNVNGTVTLGSAATIGAFGASENINFANGIAGTGDLSFNTEGGNAASHTAGFIFNGASTYTGNTTLSNGSAIKTTLTLGVNNALPTTTVLTLTTANTANLSAILNLNGKTQTVAGLSAGGNATNTSVQGGGTLTINDTAGFTYGGLITGATGITKSGAGTETFTASNSYTGATTVNAGILNGNNTSGTVFGTSAITVNSGGELQITNHAGGVPNLTNALTLNGSGISGGGALFYSNSGNYSQTGTLTLSTDSVIRTDPATQTAAINFTGLVSGAGGLTMVLTDSGAGEPRFTLSNANNTYAGATILTSNDANTAYPTTVASGVGSGVPLVELGATNALASTTTLTFGGTPAGATGSFNGNVTLLLDGISQTVAGLATNGTGTYRIAGNGATLSTFTVNNAAANAFSGNIGGTGTNNNNLALSKTGAGTLTLSGTSTYTGGTTVSAGNLTLIGTGDLGAGAVSVTGGTLNLGNGTTNGNAALVAGNAVTLASGTTLAFTQTNASNLTYAAFPINMNGNATVSFNGGNSFTTTLTSPIVLSNTSGTQTATIVENDAANTVNLQGVISGAGDLKILPSGISNNPFLLTLNQTETYTGNTTIQTNGGDTATIKLLTGGSLPATTILTLNGSATASNFANFDLNGQAQTLAGLTSAGTAANDRVINSTTGTTSALTINNTVDSTYGGLIGVSGGANISLTKSGSAMLTLTGANVYSGNTNVNAGTLAIAGAQTGAGQLIVSNAGILQFGNGTSTAGSSVNSGTVFVNDTGTVRIAKTDGGTFTNQVASNPGAVTTLGGVNATGTTNTFTATEFSNGGSFTTNSTTAGAVLAFNNTQAIDLKTTNLIVQGAGDTLFSGSIYSSTNTGNTLAKNGTGTLIYQANQGYTGETDINAGAVRADVAQTNGGTYFVGNGGTTATAATLLLGGGTDGTAGGVSFNRGVTVNAGDGTDRNVGGTNTSGTDTYTSNIALDGNPGENRSVNLTAATGGTVSFAGGISGAGQAITKIGGGIVSLDATTSFSGATTVNAGTLRANTAGALAATTAIIVNNGGTLLLAGNGNFDRVNNSSGITLASGTLMRTGTASEGTGASINGATTSGASSIGLGALTLTANSTLDFGSGGVGTLTFASFAPGTFTLNVSNYANTTTNMTTISGVDNVDDRLIFAQDQMSNLANFNFGGVGAQEINLGNGYFEVVPVPEPATWIGGAFLLAIAAWQVRRRSRCQVAC